MFRAFKTAMRYSMLKKSTLFGVIGLTALVGCSDSVLFDKGPVPVGGPGAPAGGMPGGAPGTVNGGTMPGGYGGGGAPGSYNGGGVGGGLGGVPQGGYPAGQQGAGGAYGQGQVGYPQQGQQGSGYPQQGGYAQGQQGYGGQQSGGNFSGQGQMGYPNQQQQQGAYGQSGGFLNGGSSRSTAVSGYASGSGPVSGGSIQRSMTFTLNADSSLTDDEVFQILFTDQAVDPFKVNQIDSKSEMKMLVKSVEQKNGDNFVKIKLILTMKMGQSSSLVREFVTDAPAVISSENSQDVLEGVLLASDKRGSSKIFISARRSATPANVQNSSGRSSYDETYLWKNAWSGEIKVEKSGRKLRMGSFQGFMSSDDGR